MKEISIAIALGLLSLHGIQAQHATPLFNDTLDMAKILSKPRPAPNVPRSFDADNLIVRDDQGNVIKDLRESPCWHELGYNPMLSRQANLDEYEYCEGEKRKKLILTVVSISILGGFLWLIVRSAFRKANPIAGP